MIKQFREFPFCNFFKTKTHRFEWNERESTRIPRVQAPTSCSQATCMIKDEQDLPLKQKSKASEGSNSAVKHENVVSKVAGLKKQVRKHRSDSKLDASRRQCQTAEQTARRLLYQREGNARPHENETTTVWQLPATKVLTQLATSYSETMWAKTSKTQWTWNPGCSQTALISGFNMRVFLLLLEESL